MEDDRSGSMDDIDRTTHFDMLVCLDCEHTWSVSDQEVSITEEAEGEASEPCPSCGSRHVVREERG